MHGAICIKRFWFTGELVVSAYLKILSSVRVRQRGTEEELSLTVCRVLISKCFIVVYG